MTWDEMLSEPVPPWRDVAAWGFVLSILYLFWPVHLYYGVVAIRHRLWPVVKPRRVGMMDRIRDNVAKNLKKMREDAGEPG